MCNVHYNNILTPEYPFGSHCIDCHAITLPRIDDIAIKMPIMPHTLANKMYENTAEFYLRTEKKCVKRKKPHSKGQR